MPRRSVIVFVLLLTGTGAVRSASAQQPPLEAAGEWAWTTIVVRDGVRVSYVFYPAADQRGDGVVLRLDNRNTWPVAYRFVAVFRSGDGEVKRPVSGRIEARSIVTGDSSGLSFVPFSDGRSVSEIGLRGFEVERAEGS